MKTLIASLFLLCLPGLAAAQCHGYGYQSYAYSTPTYVNTYTPYYVPVAVAYPAPYYGSSYGGDTYSAKNEIEKLKTQLELDLLKKQIASLQPAPVVVQPPPQQTPPPAQPEYAPPRQAYAPPAAPSYAPPVQEECQTCKQKQAPSAPYYPDTAPPQGVPPQAPRALQYAPKAPRTPAYAPPPEDDEIAYAQPPRQRAPASRGQHVGAQNCAACHTPSQAEQFGDSRILFRDEAGMSWDFRTPAEVRRSIKLVEAGTMPKGHKMSDPDKAALIAMLRQKEQQLSSRQRVARREE